jgi:LPS export ABC transporter protein LptC
MRFSLLLTLNLKSRWGRSLLLLAVLPVVLTAAACQSNSRGANRLAEDSAEVQQIDNTLTFENITLEQADESGDLVWEVFAEAASYNENNEFAAVTNPDGQLFQEGEAIYEIRGDRGQVYENGQRIVLRGNVEVVDLRTEAVLKGEEMEWQPGEQILMVRRNFQVTHPEVRLSAREGRLYDQDQRMELTGRVIARTRQEPTMVLRSQALTWLIAEEKMTSDRPIEVRRLQNDRVTDIASGQRAEVDLSTNRVTLQGNAQIAMEDPMAQVNSPELIWNIDQETLRSNQPLRLVQPRQQLTITANQGQLAIDTRILTMQGDVRAIAQRNQSTLTSDNLVWNLASQEFRATGNVDYRQPDPQMVVNGPTANGRLQNQTIVISGGRVVSEIVPEE